MKRVVTVALNGLSFNFDEDAYDALRSYLKRAEAQLAADPGRAEVIADLERSIAEKCQPFLSPQKNVITAAELAGVLAQIGMVEGYSTGPEAGGSARSDHAHSQDRPLLQVREGAMISGVCNGLAAKFGFDVTLIRVIFVILAIATSGGFTLIYIAMMFLIPYDTDVEKINDQSVPGFMFKLVTQTKRKLAGTG